MADASRPATLAETGLKTTALFKQIKRIDQNVHEEEWPSAMFAAQSDRFDLWAVNLGLFVSGHGSLDYRIREAESLERTIHRFIKDLNDSLKEVLEYRTGEPEELENDDKKDAPTRSFDDFLDEKLEEESDQELESDLELLLDSVKDPIDRLYKLSTRIRNPSSRLGSSKALQLQQVDPDSGVDLLQVFEVFDYDFASSLFLQYRKSKALDEHQPLAPHGDGLEIDTDNHVWEPIRRVLSQYHDHISVGTESFLVQRLARANVRRRQQFAYWKRHRDKLSHHTRTFTQNIEAGEDLTSFVVDLKIQSNEMPLAPVVHSVTTATRLNIAQLVDRDDRSTVSVSEYAPSAWCPGKEIIDFPPSPKQGPDEKFFECPYCFTLCSTDLLNERAWKAHLIHDLRPYICTYESCKNPDQLYDNRRDWIQHENWSHRRVWRCPEHQYRDFLRLEEYREHLTTDHPEYSDEALLRQLIHSAESSLVTADRSCPICELVLGDAKSLHSHIALHLERFSLFSLPRSAGDADTTSSPGDSDQVNITFEGSRDDDFDSDLPSLGIESTRSKGSATSKTSQVSEHEESLQRPGVLVGFWADPGERKFNASRDSVGVPSERKVKVFGALDKYGVFTLQTHRQVLRGDQWFWTRDKLLAHDQVFYESRLQDLTFLEIKEYCRLKMLEIAQQESDDPRRLDELRVVKEAKLNIASQKLNNDDSADEEGAPTGSLEAEEENLSPDLVKIHFESMQDNATTLARALRGEKRSPDTEDLVEILPLLTHEEVLDLRVEYKKIVKTGPEKKGVNIAKHIKVRLKEVDSSLMKACYACALGKWESEAYWANFWYQSEKSRRELLIEALMGRTNREIKQIKDGFSDKKYNDSLTTCMRMELKEDKFKKAVLLVLEERRMEENVDLDEDLVASDLEELHKAVNSEEGSETMMINTILIRSDTHLRAFLKLYEQEYQTNFAREMLKKSGNLVGEILAHVLNGVINRPVRDALLINHALTAPRKDELHPELIISRLVRYHWDRKHMINIKKAFKERYGKDLSEAVHDGTYGEWGKFCERLCDTSVVSHLQSVRALIDDGEPDYQDE